MAFNPDHKTLKDDKIREAISKAINTNQLSDQHMRGIFQRDVQFVNDKNQQQHDYNIKDTEKFLKRKAIRKIIMAFMKRMVNHYHSILSFKLQNFQIER